MAVQCLQAPTLRFLILDCRSLIQGYTLYVCVCVDMKGYVALDRATASRNAILGFCSPNFKAEHGQTNVHQVGCDFLLPSESSYFPSKLWVHANGGIINGGVACVCAKLRVFVHSCAFLRFFVRFCAFSPAKMACRKAQFCS